MINTTHAQIQLSDLQTQPQVVSLSAPYLAKIACFNFQLNPMMVTTDVPSDLDPSTSRLHTHKRFVTLLS